MSTLVQRAQPALVPYRLLVNLASHMQSAVLLVVRLYWGWQFFVTGRAHLTHLSDTTDFFASLGIPAPHLNAIAAGSTEMIGGLLLLAGVGSRAVAIPLIGTMVVAYLTADLDKVKHLFANPDRFVMADPFLFLLAAVLVLVFGPGRFSIDWLAGRLLTLRPGTNAA